jgi:hypothetical protein
MACEPGLFRHIGERPVPVAAVEPVPEAGVRFVRLTARRHWVLERRAIYKEQILLAVIVVVQHRDTAYHRFREILLRGVARRGDEADTGTIRRFAERDSRGGFGKQRAESDCRDESQGANQSLIVPDEGTRPITRLLSPAHVPTSFTGTFPGRFRVRFVSRFARIELSRSRKGSDRLRKVPLRHRDIPQIIKHFGPCRVKAGRSR